MATTREKETMSTPRTAAPRTIETLKAAIAGRVFVPGEAGYDQGRRAWNLAVDQRPAIVVEAESADDVAQAVRYARARRIRIAPQGTGHGAGPLEPLDGAMLLRTTRMRKVHIDPAARTARAEVGAVWQDVTVPAAQHGLAALAGKSPNVGVAGYTLGGGLGWLARHYGMAANSVTAAELVTPDGNLVRAEAEHEPDLFWAVRGGGGMGVVTALEMTLYPVSELYAGDLFFPIQRAAEVLRAWGEWTGTVPDEVTSVGHLLRLPPLPELPEPLRGRAFVVVEAAYLGDAGPGAELIGPLRPARPGTRHLRDHPTFRALAAEHGPRPADALPRHRRVPVRLPRRRDRCPGRAAPARIPARRWPLSRSATWAARWPVPHPTVAPSPASTRTIC